MNVVITGASRGIGRAIAEAFAVEGANLILCSKDEKKLLQTVREMKSSFPDIDIVAKAFDLSIKKEAISFGNWCIEQATPDVLINNAGNFLPGSIYNEDDGVLEAMVETNLYSAYHVTRSVVTKMIESKRGHIFNICSIAALQAYNNGGSYSISKYALMGFSKNLREELKPFNIKVTSVYPGAVLTDSWGDYNNSNKRIMEANDVAKMIVVAAKLSPAAVAEDIVLRPQLGDL
ncbi:SDR family oxidoreductase [Ferruginibacter albus]|uniref:SDR family oxidoreductase n=1 Tax=Ferruginibacter albus TaxID=2875540 RepID=UPI001CC4252C|nr:SDR family oxidoreductase [Ferruginibacter albus]UAY51909.1 SDR family oxidoreductase [Ferruginibacter albus]